MKYLSFVIAMLIISCNTKINRTFEGSEIAILPNPETMTVANSSFALEHGMAIRTDSEQGEEAATYFTETILAATGMELAASKEKIAHIYFNTDTTLSKEGYKLVVTPEKITITASEYGGFFYGVQSLIQLVFKENIEGTTNTEWLVPSVTINDAPRFTWRAYMLDESRYFQGEAFVKQMLDEMGKLKLNIFHWHLIDDAGWRIEIKKYPLLTEIGSKRTDSEIETWKSGKTSGEPHSGFYTQEQIKDIVAYAAKRNITIVPEFEMPGHSSAAIAAYTWLGTAGVDIDVPVKFGRLYDNYDVTKPEVIQFVKDVLLEIFTLFPSEVIHIGGDEVGYKVWEDSESVQKYMKEHGIKTPADLQIDFTNKISKFMQKNGRRMMGWNEILGKNIHDGFEEKKNDKEAETELAKNAVVHFWKGDLGLAEDAAKKGYDIVNSIHTHTYLDYGYDNIPLEKAYNFNPIPEGLEEQYQKNIIGMGTQMWSEWAPTNADIERQTFPRIAAYAEVGWSQLENKDYQSFKKALKKMEQHWEVLGINYSKNAEKETKNDSIN